MDRNSGTGRSQHRFEGRGRGPPQTFHDRRDPRRGGSGDHREPRGPPGWREQTGPGQFRQHRPPGYMSGRGPPVPPALQGPPPPPPRHTIPPPPPPVFSHCIPQAYPSNFAHGRGNDPPGSKPPVIQRGHGPGPHSRPFQQHPGGPFTMQDLPPRTNLPPPPPPLQPYPIRTLNDNSFPTIHPPLTGFIPQPSILSVHPPVQAITATANHSNSTFLWSEFTSPAGVKYYYNSVTKESTYEKPAGFVSPKATSSQQQDTKTASTWTEYTDAATGKMYYSDGITTTWEKPASFSAPALSSSSESASTVTEKTSSDPPRKKLKMSTKLKSDFGSKDEAIAAFKGLLIAKDVSPTLKWSELTKLYSSDSRWILCEDALTTGERKQALAEYQTKRANELRLLERQEKIRAREAFMELLTESLPKLKSLAAWKTSFKDIRDSLAKDGRFHVVTEESQRESLFLDFCEEVRKSEERKKRDQRRKARDNFVAFLSEKQERGCLSFASTWNSFMETLDETDKNDKRFAESIHMSDSDREIYFSDFVHDLQASEDEKRRLDHEARRRAEQSQRHAFEDFLCRLASDEGKLFPWSGWTDLESEIIVDSSYEKLRQQNSDAPMQTFEDFVHEWKHRYRKDRELLEGLMRPTPQTEFVVDRDTPYETFTKAILETAQISPGLLDEVITLINQAEPVSSAKIYFKEMQSRNGTARSVSRRAGALRRGHYDSSEDEGEITEDPEIGEGERPSSE